ncbi:REJ domain protein (macronuclear) [Tetrahymena thermophila SB210]|uniref:REJ domain protein n=1 Tax=Tetrahymena thermophila (strain SB210) TaxID=312017 RepID=Q22X46_TETTS|nr:REJ domain protein [Tetrahymena thermophila SB210]EAR89800.4 REJ domain protein [Tetrahymena thermophila SB210]|eukprot:XP_001010045.4 REJ domain protein [Tetrahymena thermophila SB210]
MFLLIILQIIKHLYAVPIYDCSTNVNIDHQNPQFRLCLINYGGPANQSDQNTMKQYFQDTYCLNSEKYSYDQQYYLTGSSCTSNSEIKIQYNSTRKIYSYFLLYYLYTQYPPNDNLKSIFEINNVSKLSAMGYIDQFNQCQDNCDSCDYNQICQQCSLGFYYQHASNQCLICDKNCASCNGPSSSNCLTCNPGLYFDNTLKQCIICDPTCKTCDGSSSNNCLSCNIGIYYNQSTKQCICDPTCKTCDGPTSNSCLSCNIGIYYNQSTKQCICDPTCKTCDGPSSNSCLSCNIGIYYNQSTKQCICDPTCKTCDGPTSNSCLSCNIGLYYNQSTKQCICDPTCKTCDGPTSNSCLSCNIGLYYNQSTKQCICDPTCKTCDGPTSNSCLSCMIGLYYNQSTKQCICDPTCKTCDGPTSNSCLSCNIGLYYNQSTKQCICDPTCKTCDGPTSNSCLSCNIGIYYNQSTKQCICDPTCKTCDGPTSNSCLSCDIGIYYNQSTKQCICDPTCKTCDGPTSNSCLSCIIGLYYNQSTKQCICDPTCKTCDGPTSNSCLSCNIGLYYNQSTKQCICDPTCKTCDGPTSNSCLSCNIGIYYNQSTKQCLCDQTCKTCDGPTQYNCLTCNSGLYYQQASKQCVQSCNNNQFANLLLQQCELCDNSCASCYGKDSNNCLSCYPNSFLYNKNCINPCPNGFQSNFTSLTCDSCQYYWSLQCNPCYPSCQLCDQSQILNKQCKTCYKETRILDSNNHCICQNKNDQRDIFYQCSYKNIAVIDARLSAYSPSLTIDFGSPLVSIISNTPQSLCSQIFEQSTLDMLGLDSQCQISGNQIQVNLSDSSKIMENNSIIFLPNKLQFIDYSTDFINVFYRNTTFQDPPGVPQLLFSYNHIENSCNSINITLYNLQYDAGRKFMSLNWTLNQIVGSISNEQQEAIKQILQKASQNKNTSLIINSKYIPPNINITIQFSYLLKVNQTGSQTFTIIYQKQKFIRANYQQSKYPPIYRSMSLSFYFQFYVEICELGQITYFNEPVDLQLVSSQLQNQSLSQYNQSSFQYDILPYSLASNQTFNMSLILNLSSDSKITAIQNISVNIQITDLYLQIIGGSSLVLGYQNKMVLNTDSRDYEMYDQNSSQNINFSWKCFSLSSIDHICYDYQNKQIQLPQGASNITFPAKTFQPYTAIQITVVGQKDNRQSNFTTTCIFTELDIPPLNVLQTATSTNRKINLNDDLNFQIVYGENISSDYLSYAGAILYDNNPVAAIKFDYFQVRFRIWNYFQNIDPSKPTLQIRFSVYNPLFVMPSLSTISIQINIPPHNCVLNINPQQGIALETIFQIQFLNCIDEDLPLTYQFFYYNSADDANLELISPWNILRRQIQDQTINSSIQTVLPKGNLVIMAQVMDSYLGVYNTSSIIQVQAQNKSADEYYKQVNQLTSLALQSSNIQITNQLVTLSIIAEDISKSYQLSNQLNDLISLLIQNIQQLSLQIPKFSLLSTFANKVTAQLSQVLFSSSYQNNVSTQKNKIFDQLQTIIQNTNSSIQSSNLSHLQQNNDVQIQNMVDSFKILNSSVSLQSNNSQNDFESYDKISIQIGNLLNNVSLPNQGQIILDGSLSTLLSDKVTQKNLFQYVLTVNNDNSVNQTSVFSISRNNYKQNIYENTSDFQVYTQQFKNVSQNFTYSKNELISPQIYNFSSSSQTVLNQSSIVYQFDNTNSSKLYNMTCIQQNNLSWSKSNCDIHKITQKNYMCFCESQKPTTIIEDIDDLLLKNKNLQTAFGEQGLLNIASFENFYMYIVFWLLLMFTLVEIFLFIIGKLLDKQTVKKQYSKVHNQEQQQNELQQIVQEQQQQLNEINQNICENSQMINNDIFQNSPFAYQLKSHENIQAEIQQNQQVLQPFDQKIGSYFNRKRKRQKFLNLQIQQTRKNLKQVEEQNIQMKKEKAESNQLQVIKQQSSSKSDEKIKTQTSSQTQIKEVQDENESQKIIVYLSLPKAKKYTHQLFQYYSKVIICSFSRQQQPLLTAHQ